MPVIPRDAAGAGRDLVEARRPAVVDLPGGNACSFFSGVPRMVPMRIKRMRLNRASLAGSGCETCSVSERFGANRAVRRRDAEVSMILAVRTRFPSRRKPRRGPSELFAGRAAHHMVHRLLLSENGSWAIEDSPVARRWQL